MSSGISLLNMETGFLLKVSRLSGQGRKDGQVESLIFAFLKSH